MDKYEKRRIKLLELRDSKCSGKVSALAKRIDRDPSYVSRMLYPEGKAGRKRIADDMIEVIELAFNLPRHWMDTDQGKKEHANTIPAQIGTRKIPLISYVQAGAWTETIDPYQTGDAHEWLLTDLDLSEHAFGLEIKGDSMLPDFKPGDRVIIDPAVSPCPGDFVVAKNGEEEATFKKYRPRGRNEKGEHVVELVPLNPDYESLRSDITPFVIIGTMVEARRYRKKAAT